MNSFYSIFASLYDPKGYKLDLESCFDVSEVECVSSDNCFNIEVCWLDLKLNQIKIEGKFLFWFEVRICFDFEWSKFSFGLRDDSPLWQNASIFFFFPPLSLSVCVYVFLIQEISIYKQLKGTLFRIFQCLMRFNNEFWIRIWSCTFFFSFFLNLVLQLIKTFYVNLIPLYGFNWLVTHHFWEFRTIQGTWHVS